MKTKRPSLPAILFAFAAAAVLVSVILAIDAGAKTSAEVAHRRALASLDGDLALLAECESIGDALSALGEPPEGLPLPVSLPAAEAFSTDVSPGEDGWRISTYSAAWRVPPRAALDIIAALFNLDRTWHVASLSFRPSPEGDGIGVEAEVTTARRTTE